MRTETTDTDRKRGALVVRVVGVLVIVGSVAAFCLGFLSHEESRRFESAAVKTDGTLVGTQLVTTDGGRRKAPVFSYRDQSGKSWRITDTLSGDYTLGRKVPVYYLPTDPGHATLDPDADLGLSGALLLVATAMLAMGVWTIRVGGKIARGEIGVTKAK